jgi:DMSO/TMAO reductase YedYZ molybdopterin-dependent catalytic subunit
MSSPIVSRRSLITGLTASAAGLLTGCDSLARDERFRKALFSAENMHKWLQRSLQDRQALAQEFRADQRSRFFRGNGTLNPNTEDYKALWRSDFADWRLRVDGLVARPLSISLAQLHAMPHRVQTTRHDCVEGWSAIGMWHGVPLSVLLHAAGISSRAKYVVFHCADRMGNVPYYESVDMIDAFHPQTILAWGMNKGLLTVPHGAPLRLRVERQLGYKHAKYVQRIEAVESLSGIHGGKGGYWEDKSDYEWYAGI